MHEILTSLVDSGGFDSELLYIINAEINSYSCSVFILFRVALSKPTTVHFCCLWVKQGPTETLFFQRSLGSFCPTLLSITQKNDMA